MAGGAMKIKFDKSITDVAIALMSAELGID